MPESSRASEGMATALRLLSSEEARLRADLRNRIPPRFQSTVTPDDVLQELRITLLRTREVDIREVHAWLQVALRNALLAVLRRARTLRRGGHLQPVGQPAEGDVGPLLEELARTSGTPSRVATTAENRRAITVALAALPEPERQALCLCHLEGLSRKEAAEQMGRTEGAVNALVFRALRHLRELLGEPGAYFSGGG